MPLTKLNFAPGLDKDDSPLASEGGWVDADHVRFVNGRPQTIGGYQRMVSDTFAGIPRGAHAWADLIGRRFLAWGTAANLYALVGGEIRDITPLHSQGVLTDPFTTVSGSSLVTVEHPFHAFETGAHVTFAHAAPVGGLTVSGLYKIMAVDAGTYTITAAGNATSSATGGGAVDYTAALPVGLVDGAGEPGGYGAGAYSEGGYGETSVVDSLPRIWFLDNWGETLVALPRGGALYQYQPALAYPELVSNGDFVSATVWTSGVGWTIGAGTATAVAGAESGVSQPVAVTPGYIYRVTVDVTRTAGTLTIQSDAGTLGVASTPIAVSGTYSRVFRAPAGMTRLQFLKDTSFSGSIDNVSLTLESIAYRIDEAPYHSSAMFVDPHQLVVLCGTTPQGGGALNPMAMIWCDRQDITNWVPDVDNLAGDDILSTGTRIVGGLATRQQNLIWTDSALYTMQYTGDPSSVFRFDLAGTGCGLIGALARAEHNGLVFWAARGNFYSFSGAVPQPIPCRIERDTFGNIAEGQGEKIVCGIIPGFSEAWFLYPDARDGNECSRYAAFRWDENHWTAGTFARSAFVKPGVYEYPIMFGTDGVIYEHENGQSANGNVLDAYLTSAYFDVGDGETLMMIRRIVGDFDDLSGYVDFTLYGRKYPTAAESIYGPFRHTASTDKLDTRMSARQAAVRLESSVTPCFWRLGSLRFDVLPLGARR